METREEKALLKSQADCLCSLAFSPDRKVLAAGGNRGKLIFWDSTKQAEITSVHCGDQNVYALAFSADGKILASASSDGYVMLWELATKQTKRTLRWHDGSDMENYLASNGSAAFSPDLKVFASCGGPGEGPGEIWLRDMVTGKYITTLKGHSKAVSSVAFSPDGNVLASGGWDKKVRPWDVADILKKTKPPQ